MADSIKIIDPYSSYDMAPQQVANGVYGNDFLNAVKSLQVGFGTQVLRIDRQGLWLGAADFATAPFSVDMAGNMVATSLDLSAYLQVGESLTDIQALIGDISDIDTNLGTITAGNLVGLTVTGGLIRTSTSGARVEIDGTTDSLEVFDSSGERRIMLDSDEIIFYDGTGAETGSLSALVSNIIGLTFPSTKLGFVVYSSATAKFAVSPTAVVCYQKIDMQGNDIEDVDRISGTAGYIDFAGTGGVIRTDQEISPEVDNVEDLGDPTEIWNDIYVDEVHYNTLTAISDKRIKENVEDVGYGLKDVLKLKPILYNLIEKEIDENAEKYEKFRERNPERFADKIAKARENIATKAKTRHTGFIAQDVDKVIPEIVQMREDGLYTLRYIELVPVLVKAIQELSEELEKLKKK